MDLLLQKRPRLSSHLYWFMPVCFNVLQLYLSFHKQGKKITTGLVVAEWQVNQEACLFWQTP